MKVRISYKNAMYYLEFPNGKIVNVYTLNEVDAFLGGVKFTLPPWIELTVLDRSPGKEFSNR